MMKITSFLKTFGLIPLSTSLKYLFRNLTPVLDNLVQMIQDEESVSII